MICDIYDIEINSHFRLKNTNTNCPTNIKVKTNDAWRCSEMTSPSNSKEMRKKSESKQIDFSFLFLFFFLLNYGYSAKSTDGTKSRFISVYFLRCLFTLVFDVVGLYRFSCCFSIINWFLNIRKVLPCFAKL